MKNKKMSLILIVAMLFTMIFNTMAFAEEGFEGDAAQVQDFILNHADAKSVLSKVDYPNIDEWHKSKSGKEPVDFEDFAEDVNEDGTSK